MIDSYGIILGLFTLAGLALTFWGWKIYRKARKTAQWPGVDGVISESNKSSARNDLLPHIVFEYAINGQTYHQQYQFPSGTTPMPEDAERYVAKFPLGSKVHVFYNPQNPAQATLEPGLRSDDWMILALGILTTVSGIGFLFFSG